MLKKVWLILAGIVVALQSFQPAKAIDVFPVYPFLITSGATDFSIKCDGFWFRTSGCVPLSRPQHLEFYRAISTLFAASGGWSCEVYSRSNCTRLAAVRLFCLPNGKSVNVELEYSDGKLTVNQPLHCRSVATTGVLGQNGEDDRTPAQDQDTYNFAGKAGEKVGITLDCDGSRGSAGKIATLRVRTASGPVLAQRTGSVPLSLELALPGPVEVVVRRQPGDGNAFRGYYTLEVVAESGDIGDRQLRPSVSVEQ